MTHTDDDSTPRTNNRQPSGEHTEDVTRYRLDRIEAQNDEQSRKIDKMTLLLTKHVERQESHDKRIAAVELTFGRAMWSALVAALGSLGSMILALLPHADKASK